MYTRRLCISLVCCAAITAFLSVSCKNKPTEPEPTPPVMKLIPGGTFNMGSADTNFKYAQPVHSVTVSSFYMDSTEVTQGDYWALLHLDPWQDTGSFLPAGNVSWFDAVLYCNARSSHYKKDPVYHYDNTVMDAGNRTCDSLINLTADFSKNGYRLPTEAEWEFACRALGTTDYYWGSSYPPASAGDTAFIDFNAVWSHNSSDQPQNVATKFPNFYGLYDMSGNVQEWCNDWFHENYYASSPSTDPVGPDSSIYLGSNYYCRVQRGGSCSYNSSQLYLASAARYLNGHATNNRDVGFRCVCRP